MATINRNGKAYDSADVSVQINGVPINVKSIEYSNEQAHQLNETLGGNKSWSMGAIKPSASITLMMEDAILIEQSSGGRLLAIKPFVITIEFINDFNIIVVDKVIAKFENEGRNVTGDMGLEFQYKLFALSVELNVPS